MNFQSELRDGESNFLYYIYMCIYIFFLSLICCFSLNHIAKLGSSVKQKFLSGKKRVGEDEDIPK